ncbi:hypothetical protein J5N97_009197 [Dioscorea zingiberensis]|uniref:Uncharacterized protein n=1 Tax=Dioscorea zingiberensis TaxID=325984 RepID=A0A9D5HM16_9LILI|nr:hypothetical protein J5N97_009197 [Dioscorea zingiberensis]
MQCLPKPDDLAGIDVQPRFPRRSPGLAAISGGSLWNLIGIGRWISTCGGFGEPSAGFSSQWVARGDLGAELPIEEVPLLQFKEL